MYATVDFNRARVAPYLTSGRQQLESTVERVIPHLLRPLRPRRGLLGQDLGTHQCLPHRPHLPLRPRRHRRPGGRSMARHPRRGEEAYPRCVEDTRAGKVHRRDQRPPQRMGRGSRRWPVSWRAVHLLQAAIQVQGRLASTSATAATTQMTTPCLGQWLLESVPVLGI
jgi:hypothetical protein